MTMRAILVNRQLRNINWGLTNDRWLVAASLRLPGDFARNHLQATALILTALLTHERVFQPV